jgi:hypothetical protein
MESTHDFWHVKGLFSEGVNVGEPIPVGSFVRGGIGEGIGVSSRPTESGFEVYLFSMRQIVVI